MRMPMAADGGRPACRSHRQWRRRRHAIGLALLGGVAAAGAAHAEQTPDPARGQLIAEAMCAQCHAIGTDDVSAHDDAPAFRTLSERYPVAHLEEALGEGIVVGHSDMPQMSLDVEDVGAFIAYLESIQTQ